MGEKESINVLAAQMYGDLVMNEWLERGFVDNPKLLLEHIKEELPKTVPAELAMRRSTPDGEARSNEHTVRAGALVEGADNFGFSPEDIGLPQVYEDACKEGLFSYCQALKSVASTFGFCELPNFFELRPTDFLEIPYQ